MQKAQSEGYARQPVSQTGPVRVPFIPSRPTMPISYHPLRRAVRLSSSAPTRSTGTQTERPPVLCTLLTAEERERELVRDALTIIDLTLVHPCCVHL